MNGYLIGYVGKKLLCCKLYYNTANKRLFWWFSFSLLCDIIASCISGIIVTIRFGQFIRVAQCTYERIYYDSQFGELKDSPQGWEGLKTNSLKLNDSQTIIHKLTDKNIQDILNILSFDNDNWTDIGVDDIEKFKGKNWKSYIGSMKKTLRNCTADKKIYIWMIIMNYFMITISLIGCHQL